MDPPGAKSRRAMNDTDWATDWDCNNPLRTNIGSTCVIRIRTKYFDLVEIMIILLCADEISCTLWGFWCLFNMKRKRIRILKKRLGFPARPLITTENYLSARTRYRLLLNQLKKGGFLRHARPNGHVPHHVRPTIRNKFHLPEWTPVFGPG